MVSKSNHPPSEQVAHAAAPLPALFRTVKAEPAPEGGAAEPDTTIDPRELRPDLQPNGQAPAAGFAKSAPGKMGNLGVRGLGVQGSGSKGVLTRLPELELGESDEVRSSCAQDQPRIESHHIKSSARIS
eukprot:COSAG05_NODE_872_length_6839_cov_16.232938_6_plen_129_part_00